MLARFMLGLFLLAVGVVLTIGFGTGGLLLSLGIGALIFFTVGDNL